jgi:hypothetical protein
MELIVQWPAKFFTVKELKRNGYRMDKRTICGNKHKNAKGSK